MKQRNMRILALFAALVLLLSGCASGTESSVPSSGTDGTTAGSGDASQPTAGDGTTGGGTDSSTNGSAADGSTTAAPTTPTTQPPAAKVSVGDKVEFGGKQWEVTFSDDFDGTKLNSKNWTYCPPYKRQDMNNQWNRKQVTFPGDGTVSIGIDYADDGERVLSGAITTDGIFEQAYGYFEVRCRMQLASGCWSAFWLMCDGETSVGNGGRDGAEIDIVEAPFFDRSTVQHNIHWDGYAEDHKSASSGDIMRPTLYTDFHTYALEWTKDEYIFYIDGEETWRTSEGGICEVPCHMILSMETGSWTGAPLAEQMPSGMLVDYVRVYKEIG